MSRYALYCGNCVPTIYQRLEPGSVDLVVTSPPYDKLRTYKGFRLHVDAICEALSWVLKPGGVVVWVVGDETSKGSESGSSFNHALAFMRAGFLLHDTMIYEKNSASYPAAASSNRYSQVFEYMFIFSNGQPPKTATLLCDKPNAWAGVKNWGKQNNINKDGTLTQGKDHTTPDYSPRNNIWRYTTGGGITQSPTLKKLSSGAGHPAAFPLQLAQDHIKTWSEKGDTVLDPMMGSGTTCAAALMESRNAIGIDIAAEYVKLAQARINLLET